jgi:hypothetical protein
MFRVDAFVVLFDTSTTCTFVYFLHRGGGVIVIVIRLFLRGHCSHRPQNGLSGHHEGLCLPLKCLVSALSRPFGLRSALIWVNETSRLGKAEGGVGAVLRGCEAG